MLERTKILLVLGLLTTLLISCTEDKYRYWDVSRFTMDDKALEDLEEVKLLYTSKGPDKNKNLEYYIHLIVVSQKTGDTVNVLTTDANGFGEGDKGIVFNFIHKDNVATKVGQLLSKGMDIEDLGSVEDIKKTQLKKIDRVARDPNFDLLAKNNYPTIMGSIGMCIPNKH